MSPLPLNLEGFQFLCLEILFDKELWYYDQIDNDIGLPEHQMKVWGKDLTNSGAMFFIIRQEQ